MLYKYCPDHTLSPELCQDFFASKSQEFLPNVAYSEEYYNLDIWKIIL